MWGVFGGVVLFGFWGVCILDRQRLCPDFRAIFNGLGLKGPVRWADRNKSFRPLCVA